MKDLQTNEVLCSILEMLKQQAIHADRLRGWLVALAETIETNSTLGSRLKKHQFYDQGRDTRLQSIDVTIQNIDALIRQLREPR